MSSFNFLQKIYIKFLRFVEDLQSPVSDVLEELVYREDLKIHLLSPVWGSGVIKQQILENLVEHWTKLAKLGRTLEEAAR